MSDAVTVKLIPDPARSVSSSSLVTVTADNFTLEVVDGISSAVFWLEGRIVLVVPESRYLGHWGLNEDDRL